MKGLIDSNILIYLSKGLLTFSVLSARYESLFISRITYMEVLGFSLPNSNDAVLVERLVAEFPILELDHSVSRKVIELRKKKKIKLPDAIIFATALVNECELVTANEKDFSIEGFSLKIFNPMAS